MFEPDLLSHTEVTYEVAIRPSGYSDHGHPHDLWLEVILAQDNRPVFDNVVFHDKQKKFFLCKKIAFFWHDGCRVARPLLGVQQ